MDIKLKLKVKDVEIELTQEEAKKLHAVLDELVGDKKITYIYPQHYYEIDPYRPWRPSYIVTSGYANCDIGNDVQLSYAVS